MKTKVTVRLDFRELMKNKFMDERTGAEIADAAIKGILESTAIGVSPVRGVGKFVGYKAQEEAKKLKKIATNLSRANKKAAASSARDEARSRSTGYPASVQGRYPHKKIRPVNLRLTGTMLEALDYTVNLAKSSVTIGIFRGKEKLKAETHNLGTQEPNVPMRQFIPSAEGQEFVASILRSIKDIYTKRLNSIIELSKR